MLNIHQHLNSFKSFFESIRSEREVYRNKLGEYFFIVRNLAYDYSNSIDVLRQYCDMITEKAILLVGSAGNGKTNLLCRISEIAIKNKIPIMLINSRDIDSTDCKDYILSNLPIPSKLKQHVAIYLRIISLILSIQRKNFYILIDAINENDQEMFVKSLGKTIDYFSKYSRIRIVLTCRSEYFESRYKNYFAECKQPPYVFNIMASFYNDRASEKMFNMYREHFNVHGEISYHARQRLLKSLFLMRIFFEVNSNHINNITELRNAELYYSYLQRIDSEIKGINFTQIVQKISRVMIEDSQYKYVTVERLDISSEEKSKLFRVLDDNLIISRTMLTGQGITKNEDEAITFVFDEFRDFCLARYLLQHSENNHDEEYALLFDEVSEMFMKRQSPVEGIIKYAYFYFKSYGHIELSNKLLTLYSETNVQSIANRNNWRNPPHRHFANFGLSLIFIDGGEIIENEIKFLKKHITTNPKNYWRIFWFLLSNEYSNITPRLELGMKLLLEDRTYEEVSKIVACFFADRNDDRYRFTDDTRKVYVLCDWLEHINKRNKDLSAELKQFLVLICAIDPLEGALEKYKKFVLEKPIYDTLLKSLQCAELKECIRELKTREELKSRQTVALNKLLQSLMEGGVLDDN